MRTGQILLICVALTALAGCGARTGSSPRVPAEAPTAASPALNRPASIAAMALEFRGTPYREGGNSPEGFDCSGLTSYVFAAHGVALPRLAADQFAVGRPVSHGAIRRGDLVFFSTIAPGASHVGVAIDDDLFVHAPSGGGAVRTDRLSSTYWATRYVGSRRLVEGGSP